MPRGKDQKTISKRIDLHYWRKAHPLRSIRKIVVIGCSVIAAAWMAYALGTKDEQIYNPGHVTSAHAKFENDCARCHAPDPQRPGQFTKAVSDSACMTCHEAPLHAPTQLVREGGNANSSLALAVWMKDNGIKPSAGAEQPPAEGETPAAQPADAHHAGTLVSAQCAACHVEHRGREALAAVSDNHCIQCHADINKAVASGKQAQVPARVVAFNKDDHPAFGRRLAKSEDGKSWLDPTKLNFNHKVHVVDQKLSDCSMCHTTWQPSLTGFRPGRDPQNPPFKTDGERPLEWAAASDGRYMQPVNYERNCAGCHPIKVTGVKGNFAHDKIEIVRAQVQSAMQQSAMERYTAGAPGAAETPKPGGRRGGSSAKKDAGPADEGDWLRGEIEKVNKNLASVQKSCAKCHEMTDEKPPAIAAAPTVIDVIAAAHDTQLLGLWQGDVELLTVQQRRSRRPGGATAAPAEPAKPAEPSATEPAAAPTAPAAAPKPKPRKPIAPVKFQTTEPTGIPGAPRRWFAASRFDHRSHRDMTCVDCHAKLDNLDKIDAIADEATKAKLTAFATETKEVLSPGMDWTVYQFNQSSGDTRTVTESTKSCTDCHRADTKSQRFTTAACVTCHAYHDHSKEMFPDGKPQRMAMPPPPALAAPEATPTPADLPAEPAPEAAPAEPAPAEAAPAPQAPAEAAAAPAPDSPAPAEEANPAEEAVPSEPAPAPAEEAPQPARKSRRPKTSPGA